MINTAHQQLCDANYLRMNKKNNQASLHGVPMPAILMVLSNMSCSCINQKCFKEENEPA
jgi:hypothetical protein